MTDSPRAARRAMRRGVALALLRSAGLRVTRGRVALVQALSREHRPLTHGEMVALMGSRGGDPATVYRNLVRLAEAGVAAAVEDEAGRTAYTLDRSGRGSAVEPTPDLAAAGAVEGDHARAHPHFVCDDCGKVSCLPESVAAAVGVSPDWARSVRGASVELRGACPECLDPATVPPG